MTELDTTSTNATLDFNDVPDQSLCTNQSKKISKDEIKNRLMLRLPDVLRYLFPKGKISKNLFRIGDVQGNPGKSLNVELNGLKAGLWHDFATGEGGDIIDLWGVVHSLDSKNKNDFRKIMESIEDWIGAKSNQLPRSQPTDKIAKSKASDKPKSSKLLGIPTAIYYYRDVHDNITAAIYRYDPEGSKKEFRPWNAKTQSQTYPEPRPLYNLKGILNSEQVVLVEGEKCAEALIKLGICATTAMCGANAPLEKTDWSPLQNKKVIIWPDHDENKGGQAYADKVVEKLAALGVSSMAMVNIPSHKPTDGWDVANAVDEGIDVRAFMRDFTQVVNLKEVGTNLLTEELSSIHTTENVDYTDIEATGEVSTNVSMFADTESTGYTDSDILLAPSNISGKHLIKIGSDFEVGRCALKDLKKKYGQVIFAEGDFYVYKSPQWEALTPQILHEAIERYDGQKYFSPETGKTKVITLNKSKKNSAIHTMEHGASHRDFFKNSPVGVNCANGFIRFACNQDTKKWSATLEKHCPEHRQRHTLPGNWRENATIWKDSSLHSQLLEGAFHGDKDKADKIQIIKELAGSTISGYSTKLLQPRAIILLGTSAENGKSQILDMVRGLLPAPAISSVTAAKMGDEKHIQGICGKLLNASDELSGAIAISSEIFKAIITGEIVSGRDVYKSRIEFRPVAQHVFATNALPSFHGGMDRGVQRRLLIVTFNRVIPKGEKIEHIGRRIAEEEMDLLLAWAVAGALDLMNNRGFTITDSLAKNLQDWLEESDSVQGWVADCLDIVTNKEMFLKVSYAYECYQAWAKNQGIKLEQVVGLKNFVRRMQSIDGIYHTRNNKGHIFQGINLNHEAPRSVAGLSSTVDY